MENTTQAHQNAAATRPIETALEPHLKPMLTVEQQIAHMKSKGIAFKLVSEEEAAAHLREKNASSSASTPTESSSPSALAARVKVST